MMQHGDDDDDDDDVDDVDDDGDGDDDDDDDDDQDIHADIFYTCIYQLDLSAEGRWHQITKSIQKAPIWLPTLQETNISPTSQHFWVDDVPISHGGICFFFFGG